MSDTNRQGLAGQTNRRGGLLGVSIRRASLVLLVLAAALLVCSPVQARRVALVIGNAAYTQGPLANPVNDAEAIGDALRELGFAKVIRVQNATKAQMEKALGEMATESQGAEMAVVFFAGHGTERDGRNYLIPVDAKLDRASDLDLQAIALPTVLDQIAGASKLKLVILDACRNNVFPLAGNRRSATRGLARVEPEDNTLVAYAAKDGTVAQDGAGAKHSPFTAALLKHLPTPRLEVRFLLAEVRDEVVAATAKEQQPHIYGTLGREHVFLNVAAAVPVPALPPVIGTQPPSPIATPDKSAWDAIRETTDTAALKRFIERYPASSFKRDAETRLASLQPHKSKLPQASKEAAPAAPKGQMDASTLNSCINSCVAKAMHFYKTEGPKTGTPASLIAQLTSPAYQLELRTPCEKKCKTGSW